MSYDIFVSNMAPICLQLLLICGVFTIIQGQNDPPVFRNLDKEEVWMNTTAVNTQLIQVLIDNLDDTELDALYTVQIQSINGVSPAPTDTFTLVVVPPVPPTIETYTCSNGASAIAIAECASEATRVQTEYDAALASFDTTSQVSLLLNAQFDYDAITSHVIIFEACDADGCSTGNYTIIVDNGPDPPVVQSYSPSDITIVENTVSNQNFTFTWVVTDRDGETNFNWTLDPSIAESSDFDLSLDGSLLTYTGTGYNHETDPSFILRFIISDSTGLTDSSVVTVYVADVYEYPPTLIGPKSITIVENTVGNQVFSFSWDSMPRDAGADWTLDSSNSEATDFTTSSDGTTLTFIATSGYNYEGEPYASRNPPHFNLTYIIYNVTEFIQTTAVLTVYIGDMYEYPPYLVDPMNITIVENTVGNQVFSLSWNSMARDAEAEWSLDPGNSESSNFITSLNGTTLTFISTSYYDYETEPYASRNPPHFNLTYIIYNVTEFIQTTAVLTVYLEDMYEYAPYLLGPMNITIPENAVGSDFFSLTWDVMDRDKGKVFWTLDTTNPDNPEASEFAISLDGTTLTYSSLTGFNYEDGSYASMNPAQFNLTFTIYDVTDFNQTTAFIIVYLADMQEYVPFYPPSTYTGDFQAYTELQIDENLLHRRLFTTPAIDYDGGEMGVLTYTIDDLSREYFAIDRSTGVLSNWKVFDYEMMWNKTVFVTITAMDKVGNYTEVVIAVTILPVNEHVPIFIQPSYTYYIPHEAAIGTSIGAISAIDLDTVGIGAQKGEHTRYIYYEREEDLPVLLSYWDGWMVVNGPLARNTTYTFYAKAVDSFGKQSVPVQINVITFDGDKYIVDWELNLQGDIDSAFETQFENNLAATCINPCTARVFDVYTRTKYTIGNKVLKVYMLDEFGEPVPLGQILSTYTTDNKKTPTSDAAKVSPTGKVISIHEPYIAPIDWLFIGSVAGGGLFGFAVISVAITALIDFTYCSRQPYKRNHVQLLYNKFT